MGDSFSCLKEKVIDKGLCTSCGGCVGSCPVKAIDFKDRHNACIPYLSGKCIECGICSNVCVAAGFNINEKIESQKLFYGAKEKCEDDSFFLTHANNISIWQGGASGGFVTATLIYALENNIVDAVAVVGNDNEKPWLPKLVLTSSINEVIDAMQSKYSVVPTLEILSEIAKSEKRVALVLLPCQGHTFINIREKYPNLVKNVIFTIGLMCGNSLPFEATEDVLRQLGVKDINRIKRLRYRDGFWHGELHVILDDHTEYTVPVGKYMRYMADFYRKDRCKVCFDGDAIFTDISSGDGWLTERKQDGVYGWSIVHTHTKVGEDLFDRMNRDGILESISITEKDAKAQKHMYTRHYSVIPRIQNRKKQGKAVPEYTGIEYPAHLISKKNLTKKRIVDKGSSILFSEKMRKLLKPLPLQLKTSMLEFIMKLWFREK